MRRCDDQPDEELVTPRLAEIVGQGAVEKSTNIQPVSVQGVLRNKSGARTVTLSRNWMVPCFLLYLSVGLLAFLKIFFVEADGDLTQHDRLVGQQVLMPF